MRIAQIIFEKVQISYVNRIQLSRRAHLVAQAVPCCILLTWRTVPMAFFISLVSVRHRLGQFDQLLLGFPLLPPGTLDAQYKEIRSMPERNRAASFGDIAHFYFRRLVVILEYLVVV